MIACACRADEASGALGIGFEAAARTPFHATIKGQPLFFKPLNHCPIEYGPFTNPVYCFTMHIFHLIPLTFLGFRFGLAFSQSAPGAQCRADRRFPGFRKFNDMH